MMIKSYTAKSLEEAEKMAKEELGEDAIILTTRHQGELIELTAASEKENMNVATPDTNEWQEAVDRLLTHFPDAPSEKLEGINEHKIRQWIHEEVEALNEQPTKPSLSYGSAFLVRRGLHPSIATKIDQKLEQTIGPVDWTLASPERSKRITALKDELAQRIRTNGPLLHRTNTPTFHTFLGSSTSGKTSAILRLALYYQQKLKEEIQIIKIGSKSNEWNELSTMHQLPYENYRYFDEFQEKWEDLSQETLLFIDTDAVSPFDPEGLHRFNEWNMESIPLHFHLCLPADIKEVNALATIQAYSALPIGSMILTKFDECLAPGFLINLFTKKAPPVSFLTKGTEGLKIADPERLARAILTQHSGTEFESVRMLCE